MQFSGNWKRTQSDRLGKINSYNNSANGKLLLLQWSAFVIRGTYKEHLVLLILSLSKLGGRQHERLCAMSKDTMWVHWENPGPSSRASGVNYVIDK